MGGTLYQPLPSPSGNANVLASPNAVANAQRDTVQTRLSTAKVKIACASALVAANTHLATAGKAEAPGRIKRGQRNVAGAFVVTLREGTVASLIVAIILAHLVRSGNAHLARARPSSACRGDPWVARRLRRLALIPCQWATPAISSF